LLLNTDCEKFKLPFTELILRVNADDKINQNVYKKFNIFYQKI